MTGLVFLAAATFFAQNVCGEFVPIGAQYAPFCRTLAADRSEWEGDIRRMSELGYTCLHGFCEWSRIETEEGRFDFSATDELLSLGEKYGLRVLLNVATQNAVGYHMPAWLENSYRGEGVVDHEGLANPVRSIHLVPCLDEPKYRALAERYLTALARHYAGDRRVAGWIIWGEPTINKNGKPTCYCPHTVACFRTWLKGRYASVADLNRAWSTEGPVRFAGFSEVRPPVGPLGHAGGYAAWSDWEDFMSSHFADIIRAAGDILKANGATQPTINEITFRTSAGECNDVWKLAGSADIIGASLYRRPGIETARSMVVGNSLALRYGKSVFVVEQLGGSRYFNYTGATPTPEELKSEAVQSVGMGAKGAMYWCWRPRLTDYEAGAFGLCRADGKPLPRAIEGGRLAAAFRRLGRRLADASWVPQVAVFHPVRTHFARQDGAAGDLVAAQNGAVRMLLDLHVTPVFVDGVLLKRGLPAGIRALILPMSYVMDEDEAAAVARFVRDGGCAIADFDLAFKRSDGTAYRSLPGGGLDAVFGVEKDEIVNLEHVSLLPSPNRYRIPVGAKADVLMPTRARVVETLKGHPLVTSAACGKGQAHYFAWPVFSTYERQEGGAFVRNRIRTVLESCGVRPFVRLGEIDARDNPLIVATQLVRSDGGRVLTFVNPGWEPATLSAEIPHATEAELLYGDGVNLAATPAGADVKARFTLAPWQSVMIGVH